MKIAQYDTMKMVASLRLCAGQQAEVEAAVYAAREIFTDKECEAILLVYASDAFNTLNIQTMMNISVLCSTLATCVKNTYKAASRLFVTKDLELKSEEGTTQGEPNALAAYALGLPALQSEISFKKYRGQKHCIYR